MSNELAVTGKQLFMGKEIPIVLGGFGPDARCVCDKTVAEIHGMRALHVRELINRNIRRFQENADFIDLKKDIVQNDNNLRDAQGLPQALGYTNMETGKAEHIYILSERGYAKLVKIMDTDQAWDVYNHLLDEYFRLREASSSRSRKAHAPKPLDPNAEKRASAMLLNAKNRTASILQRIYDQAGVKPEYQALAFSDFYAADGVKLPRIALQGAKATYDKGAIAEKLGVCSAASGGKKPHAQAVGAIIAQLELAPEEREAVPYCRNGHDGTDYQYVDSVIEKVRDWLTANDWPAPIRIDGKKYEVVYKGEEGSQIP